MNQEAMNELLAELRDVLERHLRGEQAGEKRASPSKRWLTTDEAAAMMQLSAGTLHNWRSEKRRGRPRATYFGKNVKYAESEIQRWIEMQQEDVKPAF